MSFNANLEADFKREYQNAEFLFRQRPGLGALAALLPSVSQVPGKYLCILVTKDIERNVVDPEHVMQALTRLRDFLLERGRKKFSLPVYNPNWGRLNHTELYAILHVVYTETEIMVHLHKKLWELGFSITGVTFKTKFLSKMYDAKTSKMYDSKYLIESFYQKLFEHCFRGAKGGGLDWS